MAFPFPSFWGMWGESECIQAVLLERSQRVVDRVHLLAVHSAPAAAEPEPASSA